MRKQSIIMASIMKYAGSHCFLVPSQYVARCDDYSSK